MTTQISYDLKSKGAIAIPKDKLIQYSVLNSALKTHERLTAEDRHYAITHILGLNINESDLAKFVLQIYKLSNTGRFSLTFNDDLDTHIRARKSERIPILIKTAGTNKAWPELYSNKYLSSEEITTIEQMSNREYYAILNAIETAECSINLDEILPCKVVQDEKFTVGNKIIYNTLYSKCYDNVCLTESEQKGKIISFTHEIPEVAYVADKNVSGEPRKYCFPLMDIISRVAGGNYINPETGVRFSDRTISQISYKYKKELAMYRKYLEILNKI